MNTRYVKFLLILGLTMTGSCKKNKQVRAAEEVHETSPEQSDFEIDVEITESDFSEDGSIVMYEKTRDYAFISALIKKSFPGATRAIPLDDHTVCDSQGVQSDCCEQLILVKLINKKPVGFMRLLCKESLLYVLQIAVEKEYRKQGYGFQLLNAAAFIAHEISGSVRAPVVKDSGVCAFFEKSGFQKKAGSPHFYEYESD